MERVEGKAWEGKKRVQRKGGGREGEVELGI